MIGWRRDGGRVLGAAFCQSHRSPCGLSQLGCSETPFRLVSANAGQSPRPLRPAVVEPRRTGTLPEGTLPFSLRDGVRCGLTSRCSEKGSVPSEAPASKKGLIPLRLESVCDANGRPSLGPPDTLCRVRARSHRRVVAGWPSCGAAGRAGGATRVHILLALGRRRRHAQACVAEQDPRGPRAARAALRLRPDLHGQRRHGPGAGGRGRVRLECPRRRVDRSRPAAQRSRDLAGAQGRTRASRGRARDRGRQRGAVAPRADAGTAERVDPPRRHRERSPGDVCRRVGVLGAPPRGGRRGLVRHRSHHSVLG